MASWFGEQLQPQITINILSQKEQKEKTYVYVKIIEETEGMYERSHFLSNIC